MTTKRLHQMEGEISKDLDTQIADKERQLSALRTAMMSMTPGTKRRGNAYMAMTISQMELDELIDKKNNQNG